MPGTVFYQQRAVYGLVIVDETLEGTCPVCHHPMPRKLAGIISCPCGAKVTCTGRSSAEVLRDRLEAVEKGAKR